LSACPAPKRLISAFPVSIAELTLVAVHSSPNGGVSEGNTGHFRPHPLFDWLHTNVRGRWSAHDTGLLRNHAPFADRWRGRSIVIAFQESTDAVHFRLANPDETGSIDLAWRRDIEEGEYRKLPNTDIEVTACGLVKKSGELLDLSARQSCTADLVDGSGRVYAEAIAMAGLVWGPRVHT